MINFEEKGYQRVHVFMGDELLKGFLRFVETTEDTSTIEFLVGKKVYSAVGSDYFEALQSLRLGFELLGIQIALNGSRKDFYPSNMSRQMSNGKVGYVLELGKQATIKARTFDECLDVSLLGTVNEQREFFNQWLSSLGGQNAK